MKILFINKYDITGGAGVAAFRLHIALEKKFNTEDLFLVGIKKSNLKNVIPTRNSGFQNFVERGLNFLFNQIGLQYKFHPISTKNILRFAKEFSPNIISLHNAHGGYFQTSLLIKLSNIAPIVWTLHDMWAFTANAAHTFGDDSWKNLRSGNDERKLFPQIGLNTGNWLLKEKKRIYSDSNLTIVTPSKWLYNLAIQSPVFEGKEIIHIPNGINLDIFYPRDKLAIRKELNIPINSKVLIFGAEKVSNGNYKGGSGLINILKILDSKLDEKIQLIIFGKSELKQQLESKNFKINETGYIYDEELLAKYLSAADIFIYPTKADNLPNALIEATACGTPSITYDVGGCKEIIEDEVNGFLIPAFDEKLFVDKIFDNLKNDSINKDIISCRKIAEEKFNVFSTADNYYDLFENLSSINKM
ncbi:MAG: glycosyltransferase [Bacteroidetes bacterium]|nr:glycosyltransferase [Bacteroidota bacterium]